MNFIKVLGLVSSFVAPAPAAAPQLAPLPRTKEEKILAKAAELIEERGWSKGHLMDRYGRICARQAIFLAARHHTVFGIGLDRLASKTEGVLYEKDVVPYHMTVPQWNDTGYRTKEAVIHGLKQASLPY